MAFTSYKSLADVLKTFKITYKERNFVTVTAIKAPAILQEDITFTLNEVAYDVSEAAICENLIYPILKTAWRRYSDILAIWSRPALMFDNELSGIPDYVISKKSELGKIMFESPYVAVVEAKKDDFSSGWAQCSAEMYAIQKLNNVDLPVYGIVSNGETWEFACLDKQIFTKFREIYVIQRLDELFSVLCDILDFYRSQFATD